MSPPSALQILEITEKKVKIHKNDFNSVLKKVGARPFVLYSINGATRTGKSYALNFFIRYLEAQKAGQGSEWFKFDSNGKFVWRSGKERTTVGINLWSEPYIVKEGGREIAILLMDTQGLFDEKTTARQNAIIFSLSALCSSVSIFNLMKNIDESVLQQLQFFSGYAHLVSIDESREDDEYEAFQKLIFLIRDFDFEDYEFGYHDMYTTLPYSKNNFCIDTFKRSADSGCAKENIFVREKILEYYKDVAVVSLPHPGKKFVCDDNAKTDEDFDENIANFVQQMLNSQNLVTKKIGGSEITGLQFSKYIEAWSKLCDKADQHFPKVQTILESTAIIQNTLAFSTAISLYEKGIQNFMIQNPGGVPDSEFQLTHQNFQKEALDLFNSMKKLGSEEIQQNYRHLLEENMAKFFESNRKVNQMQQDRVAMEREYKKQQENVQKMQDDMQKMAGENEAVQLEMAAKIEQAQVELQNVAQDNLKVQKELKNQILEAQLNAKKMSKENKVAQEEMEERVNKAQAELENVTKKSEEAQETLKAQIKLTQDEAARAAKKVEQEKKNFMQHMEATNKRVEAYAQKLKESEDTHRRELEQVKNQQPDFLTAFAQGLGTALGTGLTALVPKFGGLAGGSRKL